MNTYFWTNFQLTLLKQYSGQHLTPVESLFLNLNILSFRYLHYLKCDLVENCHIVPMTEYLGLV